MSERIRGNCDNALYQSTYTSLYFTLEFFLLDNTEAFQVPRLLFLGLTFSDCMPSVYTANAWTPRCSVGFLSAITSFCISF